MELARYHMELECNDCKQIFNTKNMVMCFGCYKRRCNECFKKSDPCETRPHVEY